MGVSTEYLVDMPELVKVAGAHGFKPVFLNFFEQITGKNEYTRLDYIKGRPLTFLNFEEIYQFYPKQDLTPAQEVINGLYTTFIFIKT
jgi:hypothetical protein